MAQHQSHVQQLLASGEWEAALQQWAQAFPLKVVGIQLAAFMREAMPAAGSALLEAIERGFQQPDDGVRWQVFEQAKKVGFSTPVGALGLSLFWAYGSMTPAEQEPVYPDPALSPRLMYCALVMLAVQLAEDPVEGATLLFSRCSAGEGA